MRISVRVEKGMEVSFSKLTRDQKDIVLHKTSVALSRMIAEVRGGNYD